MTDNDFTLGVLQAGRTPSELTDSYPDYSQMFVDFLGQDAFTYRHWAVLDGDFPDSAAEADAWLITGSRHGVYEPHEWIPPLESLVREIVETGAPLAGICFGHQIIAQALGGVVEKYSGGWSVGRVTYELDSLAFGRNIADQPAPLLAFHQDQVTTPPEQAITVGRTDFCQHAALFYPPSVLTIQPHPEFNQAFVEGLLRVRGDILPETVRKQAQNSLDKPVLRTPMADMLRAFLKGVPGNN